MNTVLCSPAYSIDPARLRFPIRLLEYVYERLFAARDLADLQETFPEYLSVFAMALAEIEEITGIEPPESDEQP